MPQVLEPDSKPKKYTLDATTQNEQVQNTAGTLDPSDFMDEPNLEEIDLDDDSLEGVEEALSENWNSNSEDFTESVEQALADNQRFNDLVEGVDLEGTPDPEYIPENFWSNQPLPGAGQPQPNPANTKFGNQNKLNGQQSGGVQDYKNSSGLSPANQDSQNSNLAALNKKTSGLQDDPNYQLNRPPEDSGNTFSGIKKNPSADGVNLLDRFRKPKSEVGAGNLAGKALNSKATGEATKKAAGAAAGSAAGAAGGAAAGSAVGKAIGAPTPTGDLKTDAKNAAVFAAATAIAGGNTKVGQLAVEASKRPWLLAFVLSTPFISLLIFVIGIALIAGGTANASDSIAAPQGTGGDIIASADCEAVQMFEGTVYAPREGGINSSGDGKTVANGQPFHSLELYLDGKYKNAPEGNYVSIASDINGHPNSYPRNPAFTAYIPVLEDKFKTPITFRIHDTGGDFGAGGGPKTRKDSRRATTPEKFADIGVFDGLRGTKFGVKVVQPLIGKGFTMYVEKKPGACVRESLNSQITTGSPVDNGPGVKNYRSVNNAGVPRFVNNVPGVRQNTETGCNKGSAAMVVLHYKGSSADVAQSNGRYLVQNENFCRDNTLETINTELKEKNIQFQAVNEPTIAQIKSSIDRGDPLIVNTKKGFSSFKYNHYIVIVGYDDKYFYINDPYRFSGDELHIYTNETRTGVKVTQERLIQSYDHTYGASGLMRKY